jgi:hypothetical protein
MQVEVRQVVREVLDLLTLVNSVLQHQYMHQGQVQRFPMWTRSQALAIDITLGYFECPPLMASMILR